MFKSIFVKTVYERRWSTVMWMGAFLLFAALIILFYPIMRDSLGESLKNVPDSLQKLIGNASDYKNITGYIDIQVISQMVFLTIIQGVLLGVALLAGEENIGTLQTLLAQPVSRLHIYTQKYLGLIVILAATIIAGLFLGVLLGEIFVHEYVSLGRLIEAVFMTWLLTVFFATLAYALGAITGRRSISGGITGVYAFAAYILNSMAASVTQLKTLDYLTPFHYFNDPSVIKNGLDLKNIMVLLVAMLMLLVLGYAGFRRRDIYQR